MSSGREPSSSVPRGPGAGPAAPHRMEARVLVVDDTEAKRYFIVTTLRMVGMQVLEAASGGEALTAAALKPDVVVLDVRLPDMSGFEVCRRLKADPSTASIPILYVSAMMRDEELETRLFEDGADGYIPQPIEPKHLVAQTWALVRMHRAELQRRREAEEARVEQQRLQRELERTQARARRLTESGIVGTFYWDLDGSVLDANDTFLGLVGYTREELEAGRLDWRTLTPEWGESERQELQELLTRGVGSLKERQYQRKDGTRVDVLLGSAAFEGEPHRGVTMVVDISARREAERRLTQLMDEMESKERLFNAVLRQMPTGILIAEAPSGRSLLTNERFDTLLGYSALPGLDSFRPEQTRHLDGTPYLREELPLWRALNEGEEVREELIQQHEDGSMRLAWTCAVPVRDAKGTIVASVLTMEDITEQKMTQESLRVSEERLRLSLEAAALGVWSYEPDGEKTAWDARTRELFGLPPATPAALRTWAECLHPDDRARAEAAVGQAVSGEDGTRLELEYRALGPRDGVLRWLAVRGRLQVLNGGRRRLAGTVLDITERKRAEQHAAALQATTAAFAHSLTPQQVADALVEHGIGSMNASAGLVCVEADGALLVLSSNGYPEPIALAHQTQALPERSPLGAAVRKGQTVWVESLASMAQEWPELAESVRDTPHHSWLCVPLKDEGRVIGALGLSFSTLRRFGAQEQAHLESLCHLGAQAMERARHFEEAQRQSEAEQQFLGMVSHDLRNPLQAISLGARTLQRMERPTPEALLRMTGRIATSADTMGRMVSDLLDFTRGRIGGGIPLERTLGDLVRVCREVIDEFALTHPSHDVALEGEAVCEGWWDGPRIRQVLSNLLSNALRHAREGSVVKVRVEEVGTEVKLSVENAGEPIPGELLPVLFEPFRRGSSKFRPAGSLGLGLYIVRQVAEGHGGRVDVVSRSGTTTFTVRVPRRG